jgi:hypothetical protein
MAVLGLLLLLGATGLTLDVVFQNTSSINVDALGQTFTLSTGWLFVAAVATGAVGLLGVTMLLGGMARARRRRAILAESRGSAQDLQTDRDRLVEQLEQERAERASTPSASWPQRATAADDDGAAPGDLSGDQRPAGWAPSEDPALGDVDLREPVVVGRHGIAAHRGGPPARFETVPGLLAQRRPAPRPGPGRRAAAASRSRRARPRARFVYVLLLGCAPSASAPSTCSSTGVADSAKMTSWASRLPE